MARKSVIAGIVVAVIVVGGAAFMVERDAKSATDEIYAYRNEIIDIRDQASKATSQAQIKSLVIRLDRIRSALSYIPSQHRLASWFTDLERQSSEGINEAMQVLIPLNKRLQ